MGRAPARRGRAGRAAAGPDAEAAAAGALHADALIACQEGRPKAAIDLLDRVSRQQPSDAGCVADAGHVFWSMGLPAEAAAAFERATRLRPDFAEAHYNHGAALQRLGRGREAVEAFRQAVLLDPALGLHKLRNAVGRWFGRRLPALVDAAAWAIAGRAGLARERLARGRAAEMAGAAAAALTEYGRARILDPTLAEALVGIARVEQGQGNLTEAEELCRRAIALDRHAAGAFACLGAVREERGDLVDARRRQRQALSVRPDDSEGWLAVGRTTNRTGPAGQAEAACRRALALNPRDGAAWHQLGAALQAQERLAEAADALRTAIRHAPRLGQAHNDLGGVLHRMERWEDAIASFRKAIAADDSLPLPYFNLANALMALGRHDEGLAACRGAVERDVGAAEAHFLAGQILGFVGRLDEAAECYRAAIDLRPDFGRAHRLLGYVQGVRGDVEMAFAAFRQAIAIDRRDAAAHVNMGSLLMSIGRLNEAVGCFRTAIGLREDLADAHVNLGLACLWMRRFDEALSRFNRACELEPDAPGPHSNILATIPYLASHTAEDVAREHRAFGERREAPYIGRWPRHANRRAPDRVLNIAYMSSALRRNVQRQNMAPVLRLHNRDRVKVHVYADIRNPDDVTERFRESVDSWTYIHGLTDDQAAARIREDGIDILVHTMGHFSDNRILVCARKPAPIQVLYVCQSPTTGMRSFDYFIADRWLNEGGRLDALCSEEVIELPGGFQVTEYDTEPPIGPPPLLERGHVTFGSFNNPIKISEPCIALWARVLRAVPGSRMLVKGRGLDTPDVAAELSARFTAHGIAPDRLSFTEWVDGYDGHLGAHNGIDIALDTLPFGGGRTTEDALWMGVPVVSLVGDSVHGRLGYSHLCRVGVPELCARAPDDFVALAAGLAADPTRLADLRMTLRGRMKASPIMDFHRHVDELETAYRTMWRRWCADPS